VAKLETIGFGLICFTIGLAFKRIDRKRRDDERDINYVKIA
jgi:hypothetical protein